MDVQILENKKKIYFKKDEYYIIKYINDAQMREIAIKNDIKIKELLTPILNEEAKDQKQNHFLDIVYALACDPVMIDMACLSVQDWNILNKGKKWPCNEKNKRLFFESFSKRAELIYYECRIQNNFVKNDLGKELKN